jgi:hypothetical protein
VNRCSRSVGVGATKLQNCFCSLLKRGIESNRARRGRRSTEFRGDFVPDEAIYGVAVIPANFCRICCLCPNIGPVAIFLNDTVANFVVI